MAAMEDKSLMPQPPDAGQRFFYKEDYLLFGLLVRHGLLHVKDHANLAALQHGSEGRPPIKELLCQSSETPEKTQKDLQELLDILGDSRLTEYLPDSIPQLRTIIQEGKTTVVDSQKTQQDGMAKTVKLDEKTIGAEDATVPDDEFPEKLLSLDESIRSRITDKEREMVRTAVGKGHLIGEVLSGHLVLDKIGHGGQGEVYLAKQLSLNRYVALKRLDVPSGASPRAFLDAFRAEAETLAQINHTRIVSIYDIFEAQGEAYFTMECVHGQTLKDLIKTSGEPLATDIVANIACQACSALARTSDDGLVHRDIKPANMMLDENGDLKIVDFGLAGAEAAFVDKRGFAGTPPYAAPEQFEGEPLTAATDQYALGVTLFEALTGRLPFTHKRLAELAEAHSSADPPVPSSLNEDLSREVDRVLLKMLAKQPTDRYVSFEDCYKAWEKVLTDSTQRTAAAKSQLLGETMLNFSREQRGKLKNQTGILIVCWCLLAVGAIAGEIGLRRRGLHDALDWAGNFGTALMVFSLSCVFYVALARRGFLPTVGSLRAWLYTHIATVIPAVALLLVHSGNFMRGITPGPPQAKPVLTLLLSTTLLAAAISGSLGLLIFRTLRRRIQIEQLALRGTGEISARQAMMMALSAQILSGWRLVHYPIAMLFILLSILHIFISIKFQISG